MKLLDLLMNFCFFPFLDDSVNIFTDNDPYEPVW